MMESCKEYFDLKFTELEKNNKERHAYLVTKINGFINEVKKLAARQECWQKKMQI